MKWSGNIRKMTSVVDEDGLAHYTLPLFDILEPAEQITMNELIGKEIAIRFDGQINCAATGKQIKKTYSDGLSYDAFMKSPLGSPSIIRPELSRIHEGIALRDEEWERANHLQPHVTYLSLTAGIKVGVTRATNVPSRWVDQGAVQAVVIAEVPYRQAAGLIEVALKDHVSDKTNWRNMLKNEFTNSMSLEDKRDELMEVVPEEFEEWIRFDEAVHHIEFPVQKYPLKVTSIKLDKMPVVEKKLVGIKGQYLLFSDDTVMNLRSHGAYRVTVEV